MKESSLKKMDIVAPAGDFSKMRAAIKAGANAVYLGLKGFGARRKAGNFLLSELKEAIDYAHLRNVKVYLTLNTIMKDTEFDLIYPKVKEIYEHGIDAFIVQDLGVFKFLKENFPETEIHASTQMTIANHVEAQYLKDLGFDRVVPARELSFDEIKSIKENCDIELEVFVSGAICISYSGNCYLSSFIGGRSGNRGLCAQPCRRLYEDSENKTSFALSPKDQLFKDDEIEKLLTIGVESIKVEGRMKSEEYVYETVKFYSGILNKEEIETERKGTEKLFNRGYSKGYFYGEKNLMNPNYSADNGYKIAEKKSTNEFLLLDDIMLGDGVIFLDKKYNKISGAYINKIKIKNCRDKVKEAPKGQTIIIDNLPKEVCWVYRTYDKKLIDEINFNLKQKKRKMPLNAKIKIRTGEELELSFEACGVKTSVQGEVLEEAKKVSLTNEKISEKISELGETTFYLNNLLIEYDEKAFVSFKMLKEIKRRTAEKFAQKLTESFRRETKEKEEYRFTEKKHKNIELAVMITTKEQELAAKECGIDKIYHRQFDACREGNLDKIDLNSNLAGNLYQLLNNKNSSISADWNMNITNSYAIAQLSKINKLETVYLSPELSKETIKNIKSEKLRKALVIYGKLKNMYIEYPVFEKSESLKNENEDEFIIIKNSLGAIEIYNREAMNLIPKLDEIETLNIDEVRLDFLDESADQVRNIIKEYKNKSKIGYVPFNYEKGVY